MKLVAYLSTPPLSRFLEMIWTVQGTSDYTREKVLPNGAIKLIINLGSFHKVVNKADERRFEVYRESWIAGVQEEYILIEALKESDLIGIRFLIGRRIPFPPLPCVRIYGIATKTRTTSSSNDVVNFLQSDAPARTVDLKAFGSYVRSLRITFLYVRRVLIHARAQAKGILMKLTCFLFLLLLTPCAFGQEVRNTSYVTSNGEKVLRLELVIPVERAEAWKLFTTEEGWKRWATPVVSIDFKVGGQILSHYDKSKSVGYPGTIRLPIINYLEGEMITLKVVLNETFADKVRKEDKNLQEVIQFVDLGKGKTKIVSSMIGWGASSDWDKTYEFFAKGNQWSYQQLAKRYR